MQILLADICRGIEDVTPRTKGPAANLALGCPLRVHLQDLQHREWSAVCFRPAGSRRTRLRHEGTTLQLDLPRHPENPAVTEILRTLVTTTVLPLKCLEQDFACDSSGFMTSRFIRWFDVKYGAERKQAEWVKCHIMTGVKTNEVTAVEILDKDAGDSPQMPTLVKATAENFMMRDVSADKGYSGTENHDAVAGVGQRPSSLSRTTPRVRLVDSSRRCSTTSSFCREEFLKHYHKT